MTDEPLWLNYDRPVNRPGENIFAIDKRKLDEAALDLPGVGDSRRYPTYRGEVPEGAWVRMGVSGTDQMGPEQVMEAMRQLDIPGPRTMDEWNAALDAGQNPREGLLWHVSPEEAMRSPKPIPDDLPMLEGTEQFAKPRGQEWNISQGDLDMVGSYDPATRTITVGNVQGGDVGATALRGAIRQLQLKYPHATSIEGVRTTGG
ncbi:MAG: hypothetical protein GWN18_18150, partial [Thermoplasmata archaeon]|nr:hypothetical protein [Thermoplasmata archaeon]NIT79482.1 hypothetical protein [Thermoplasmata archaeon]NIW84438.1 hypothetical protein [Thermoplasmata archaeon]NIY05850.1 hypothetical protein [Thermoplasmata archaeon]